MKKTLYLNEEELTRIINEQVMMIISENMTNEGVWDNMKSAFSGAISGWQSQKAQDSDIEKDYSRNSRVSPHEAPSDDAAERVRQYYKLAHEYHVRANNLRNKANRIAKRYGIKTTGKGFNKSFDYDTTFDYKDDIRGKSKKRHDNYTTKATKQDNNFKIGTGKW